MQRLLRAPVLALFLVLVLCSSPATAAWQAWLGVGGGSGGLYRDRDGGLVHAEIGIGGPNSSITLASTTSVFMSSGVNGTGDLALLYGRSLGIAPLRVMLQAGPALVDVFNAERERTYGATAALHLSVPITREVGLGVRPILHMNTQESYTGLVVQLEFGKLK